MYQKANILMINCPYVNVSGTAITRHPHGCNVYNAAPARPTVHPASAMRRAAVAHDAKASDGLFAAAPTTNEFVLLS